MSPFLCNNLVKFCNFSVISVVGKVSNLILKPSLIHYESSISLSVSVLWFTFKYAESESQIEIHTCLMASTEELIMWYILKSTDKIRSEFKNILILILTWKQWNRLSPRISCWLIALSEEKFNLEDTLTLNEMSHETRSFKICDSCGHNYIRNLWNMSKFLSLSRVWRGFRLVSFEYIYIYNFIVN